jgi:hypothetical protein
MVNNLRRIFYPFGTTVLHGSGPPTIEASRSHSHTTLDRTPQEKWLARRKDLYLTTHNTHNSQTCMPPPAFELTIPASERGHWDWRFGRQTNRLVYSPVVFAVKRTTFVQSNPTQDYAINVNCPHVYATCFGLYLDHLQECHHTNIYGKMRLKSKGPLLLILSYCICCVDMPNDGLSTGRSM